MLLRRTATLSALVSLFVVVLTGTVWVLGVDRPGSDRPADRPPEAAAEVAQPMAEPDPARRLLGRWDRERAVAWEQADEGRLRALYLPGSRTGREDVRMLRRWSERGVRVVDLRTEVESVRVLERRPGRWLLEVTDRTTGSAAVGESGTFPLPQDGWSLRRVELHRSPSGWQVGEVRESAGR